MILLTDTHLGRSNEKDIYIETTINLFNQLIQTAKDNNINKIIHLGDFFDKKIFGNKNITIKTIMAALTIFNNISTNKLELYIITGNHDLIYKNTNTPNSLQFFQNDNIYIIDEQPLTLNQFTLIPWNYPITNLNANIVLGHFEINGMYMDNGLEISESNFSINDFNKFEHVYSGHIHTKQTTKNITYIGNPYQMNYGDINNERGYYIFTDKLNLIPFNDYPRFLTIDNTTNINEVDLTNNNVRIILNDKNDKKNEQLINKLKAYELQRCKGMDTVEANLKLGFKDDMRDYGLGAQMLVDIGVRKMRLLTNNPKKMVGLQGYGLSVVDQVPIEVEPNEYNRCYLECKKLKMGHMLHLDLTQNHQ